MCSSSRSNSCRVRTYVRMRHVSKSAAAKGLISSRHLERMSVDKVVLNLKTIRSADSSDRAPLRGKSIGLPRGLLSHRFRGLACWFAKRNYSSLNNRHSSIPLDNDSIKAKTGRGWRLTRNENRSRRYDATRYTIRSIN